MAKNKEEFIICDCHSEGLYLEVFEGEENIYMSFFSHGVNPKKLTLFGKLRYIWNVLKTGKPFSDQLVFSFNKAKKIAKKITEFSK